MFGLLAGIVQMAVIHYMIAKIFGPILFGRLWCGWACWTVMVLDLLKIMTRFSLLKIGPTGKECNDCGACVKMCQMDVRISEYILTGRRVLTTECSLCQTCITVCAKDSLKLSFGFDLGGKDLLRERGQAVRRVGALATAGK